MTHTTAVINMRTIKERCNIDQDGCWIWTKTASGNQSPYWATYVVGERKRINVGLLRVVAELSGYEVPPPRHHIKQTCGKIMCLNPECLNLPYKGSMFSQLIFGK